MQIECNSIITRPSTTFMLCYPLSIIRYIEECWSNSKKKVKDGEAADSKKWAGHRLTIYHHCGGQSSRFNRCPALVARSGIAEKQLIQGSLKAKSGDTLPSLTESVKPEPKKSISKARTLPVSSGVSVIQTR